MTSLVGEFMGKVSQWVVYISLVGLSTVQIIATSSNFHVLDDQLSKRDWSFVWGFIFLLMLFIPNFRHYRAMSVLGVLTTTYVAWFMTTQSLVHGREKGDSGSSLSPPSSLLDFFRGLAGLMFTFGGHSSNIEVADVLDDHTTYDTAYFYSFLYVFTLTLPNAISTYFVFGEECADNSNAFNLFAPSIQRDIGIVLMTLHQMVAFGLFTGPLYHIWEKYWGVYNARYVTRTLYRIPLAGFIVFLAIAFPFYGSVNALLGAFTTSMATYIIPLVAYNMTYSCENASSIMVKQLPSWVHLPYLLRLNWFLAALVFVCGVCIGGTAAMINFVKDVTKFELFSNCYDC